MSTYIYVNGHIATLLHTESKVILKYAVTVIHYIADIPVVFFDSSNSSILQVEYYVLCLS